jgi:aminoglycoside phosphotransferase (APT) family kinase protein
MSDEEDNHAPKFHKDRSAYGEALTRWFESERPEAQNVDVSGIDIPVATGFSNETVFFDVAWAERDERQSSRFVARIEPADGGMFPVQAPSCEVSVALQQQAMVAVAANSRAPIPRLVGFDSTGEVLGQPFFVMEYIEGQIPTDNPRYTAEGFVVDASPEQRRQMVMSGLETMSEIHALDWRESGLDWLDATGGAPSTAQQLGLYRDYVVAELNGREHPVMMATLDWLEANDPRDERIGLAWGDARLANMIWQDFTPVAVLDWEACALSPTEADMGWWLMFDRMSFDDMGIERLEGYPTREEQIEHYSKVSGREVRDAHYWEVFATMRFCAIFIRLGDRLESSGLLPPEMNPAVANMVTAAMAQLLAIDNPTPSVI